MSGEEPVDIANVRTSSWKEVIYILQVCEGKLYTLRWFMVVVGKSVPSERTIADRLYRCSCSDLGVTTAMELI